MSSNSLFFCVFFKSSLQSTNQAETAHFVQALVQPLGARGCYLAHPGVSGLCDSGVRQTPDALLKLSTGGTTLCVSGWRPAPSHCLGAMAQWVSMRSRVFKGLVHVTKVFFKRPEINR